jgi:hypothetical protein
MNYLYTVNNDTFNGVVKIPENEIYQSTENRTKTIPKMCIVASSQIYYYSNRTGTFAAETFFKAWVRRHKKETRIYPRAGTHGRPHRHKKQDWGMSAQKSEKTGIGTCTNEPKSITATQAVRPANCKYCLNVGKRICISDSNETYGRIGCKCGCPQKM